MLISIAIAAFWGSTEITKKALSYLDHENRAFEKMLMPLDLTMAFALLVGSLLLMCAASPPPHRVLSVEDIYSTNTAFRSTSSRRLLEVNDHFATQDPEETDVSPMGLYRTSLERTGMTNPRKRSGRMGRFLTQAGAALLLACGVVRLSYYLRHRIWEVDGDVEHTVAGLRLGVAGVSVLMSLCMLPVLYFVDPARVANPPPPETNSNSASKVRL